MTENLKRFVLFPIQYNELWKLYKEHLGVFWTSEEVDLSKDAKDWAALNANERHFLSHILAFFAASDGIVNENLAARFYTEIDIPEARAYYSIQMAEETIHSEMYSLLIDTYIKDTEEKSRLFNAAENIPSISKKARWALRYLRSDAPISTRLAAFAVVEGIFFSSSFCSIYWMKDKHQGKLPGLSVSNEFISRDEGLHTDFAIALSKTLPEKIGAAELTEIVREAVEIEIEFATEALPVSLIGMNRDLMAEYIKFVADRLLSQFGVSKLYNVQCPFDFMERISMQNKTNFHEKKVAEYRKAGVGLSAEDNEISFTASF